MKTLRNLYEEIAFRLCSVGSDKYVHLIAGLLISAAVGIILDRGLGLGKDTAAIMGLLAASVAGLAKESLDLRGNGFDAADLAFTILGATLAAWIYYC